jgi:hypothetical protein
MKIELAGYKYFETARDVVEFTPRDDMASIDFDQRKSTRDFHGPTRRSTRCGYTQNMGSM